MTSVVEKVRSDMAFAENASCVKDTQSESAPLGTSDVNKADLKSMSNESEDATAIEALSEGVSLTTLDPSLFSVRVGTASERGPRQSNDDFCAFSWESDFFAVSDGIGGAPYGYVMSRVACGAAIEAYDSIGDVLEAFGYANEQASRVSGYLGGRSGATLLLAELAGQTMTFVYAGDTMAYRLRGGTFEPVMKPGRALGGGNALDSAVGYGEMEPKRIEMDVAPGDRFLLCTDGVWEYVDRGDLAFMLADGDNAPMIADSICRRAADVGSDNSTCICVLVGNDGARSHRSSIPIGCTDTPVAVGSIGSV